MRLVADLVESPPEQLMYNALKDRLLASHQLTDIQKVELLVDMTAVRDRKPTAGGQDRGLPQRPGGHRVYVGPVSPEAAC